MAPIPMDGVGSFQHLVDNIPQWQQSISELAKHASTKHAEFIAEYKQIVRHTQPKRKRSPSMTSLHSTDEVPENPDERANDTLDLAPVPAVAEMSPTELGNHFLSVQAGRKRQPGTSVRSGASGPLRPRGKQMVVIHYDSHIQSELDKMVKAFGAARNNLRKGKNAHSVSKGFQLPTLGRRQNPMSPGSRTSGLRPDKMSTSINPKEASIVSTTTSLSSGTSFSQADGQLDTVQILCEAAAHQVIRDGDCVGKLQEAAGNLEALLKFSRAALELLKAEEASKEDETVDDIDDEESTDLTLSGKGNAGITLIGARTVSIDNPAPKTIPDLSPRPEISTTVSAPVTQPRSAAIEVDDDDQDSFEFDITDFRRNIPTRIAV